MQNEAAILVGYGRAEITPTISVPLAGYGNTLSRMSQGVLDSQYTSCTAITDANDNTVLLITNDIISIMASLASRVRNAVTEALGIPGDHIMLTCTHTHSSPDSISSYDDNMETFKKGFVAGVVAAATQAMNDRAPATILTGSTKTKGLNFVRHYILENGTYAGDNFGDYSSAPIADHATKADEQMQLIRFVREGKKDVLLVNWQSHAKLASTASTPYGKAHRHLLSADYVGPCREYVEANTDCLFSYHLGCAGNLNPLSNIKEENPPLEHDTYGRLVGEAVLEGLKNMTEVKAGAVQTKQVMFEATLDHTEDHMVEDAQRISKLWAETNDFKLCAAEGRPFGVISPYHANAIIRRANTKETSDTMEIDAVAVGDIAFVTAPYEMFDTNGMFVKANSPYATTFVMSCANGNNAYIASEKAFEYGSYEVHNRRFARGTAEALADRFADMLKELHANR